MIPLIALIVFAVAVAAWFIRQGIDKRRMEAKLQRRRVEDAEMREVSLGEKDSCEEQNSDWRSWL